MSLGFLVHPSENVDIGLHVRSGANFGAKKIQATGTLQFCADAAVQALGGMGFMRGTRSERIYREVKVNTIGGGTEEIMKDLAARQLAF